MSFSFLKFNNNLFRLQNRLFKTVFVADPKKSLFLQKLILRSNFARFLAIREVTESSYYKKLSGIDGKFSLTLNERFQLNEFLKVNYNNWYFQNIKNISFVKENNKISYYKLPTIADRVWQQLITFIISPSHEACFHPNNLGPRESISIYSSQKVILLNINRHSFGYQKRILFINLKDIFLNFHYRPLLSKILAPRGIKIGIFRSFKMGFTPSFEKTCCFLSYLFANIIISEIDKIHSSIRFGYDVLFFLKPLDNEKFIINKLYLVLDSLKLSLRNLLTFRFFYVFEGFNFLGWHFSLNQDLDSFSTPSFYSYQLLLKRIKPIINNSNYGANIKVSKISPLVKKWKIYNKYSIMTSYFLSLSKVQKNSFIIFNKESSQDFYSVKRLINSCFNSFSINNEKQESDYSLYYNHIFFRYDISTKFIYSFCICCGIKE